MCAFTVSSAKNWREGGAANPATQESPWGVAPSTALSYNPEGWIPAMVEAGVTTVRGFHAPPLPSSDRLAPILDANLAGVGILQWSPTTVLSLPANDIDGWRRYVTSQVTRFKGQIKYWEVWNEPPNFTVDTSPASYAKIVAVAFEAAKAVDPSIKIGLAAKSNHVNWLAESIAAGAKDKFDFVTLHPYEVAALLPQGWEGAFMNIVPNVRKMLQIQNPAKAKVPVWFTESGISAAPPSDGGVGPLVQADVLIKIYTMALAQGVGRVYWFDPSDSEGLTMGLTTADGTKRPSWYALRSLTTYLGPQPAYVGWTQTANGSYGLVFKSEKGVVMATWARAGQSETRQLASDVTEVNPRTGTVSNTRVPVVNDAPTLLVAPNGSPQAHRWQAQAIENRGRTFPWNGDHASSASVEMVAGMLPNGVFMKNAPPVTMFNNTPEYNFAGRGGPSFAVDPAFLPYGTTPIRVTAVLRSHGNGDPGFSLKYESDVPIATTDNNGLVGSSRGWVKVVGTDLYEATWTLPNARFFGMYGYHFTFDSDGPAHSQFSIVRITVSR